MRVATYNLYVGADLTVLFAAHEGPDLRGRVQVVLEQLRATDVAGRASAVARLLAREQPDVVGLQEVATWRIADSNGDAEIDVLALLLAALGEAGTTYRPAVVHPTFRGGVEVDGICADVQGHDVVLIRDDAPAAVTDSRTGLFTTTLELPTPPGLRMEARRGWCLADLDVEGRAVRFVSTHVEAWDATVRTAQLSEVFAAVGDAAVPAVVVGDFNVDVTRIQLPPGYDDAWSVGGVDRGPGRTAVQAPGLDNEPSALRERIDGVLLRGLTAHEVRVVGDRHEERTTSGLWPSDHAAVVAELELGA